MITEGHYRQPVQYRLSEIREVFEPPRHSSCHIIILDILVFLRFKVSTIKRKNIYKKLRSYVR